MKSWLSVAIGLWAQSTHLSSGFKWSASASEQFLILNQTILKRQYAPTRDKSQPHNGKHNSIFVGEMRREKK